MTRESVWPKWIFFNCGKIYRRYNSPYQPLFSVWFSDINHIHITVHPKPPSIPMTFSISPTEALDPLDNDFPLLPSLQSLAKFGGGGCFLMFFICLIVVKYTQNLPASSFSSVQFRGIKYIHNVVQPSPPSISRILCISWNRNSLPIYNINQCWRNLFLSSSGKAWPKVLKCDVYDWK